MPTELYDEDDLVAIRSVVESQMLWRGNGALWSPEPDLEAACASRFEDAFASWLGLPYAHAVNSGTSANEAAVWSLDLPAGSEVLCPSASPIFVPMAVLAAGCIPVFVDVDPDTMLVDPSLLSRALSERTRAIVALHLWGRPAPMTEIMEFAKANDLRVIEDCAQAPASRLGGQRLGTFGDVACYSLQQTKLISAGEGGVVAMSESSAYARAVLYSNTGIPAFRHGITLEDAGLERNGIQSFGHNHRMSELQASVAITQLHKVDDLIAERARSVEYLESAIAGLAGAAGTPLAPIAGSEVSWWRYPVRVQDGFGDYIGIPQTEPVFAEMDRSRTTPFGLAIPNNVSYGSEGFQGAAAGARRIRLLPVEVGMDEQRARRVVEHRLVAR